MFSRSTSHTAGTEALVRDIANLEQRLGSKKTFEGAVAGLQALVLRAHVTGVLNGLLAHVEHALRKVLRLLRSRYASPAFWEAARKLFLACQAVIHDPRVSSQLQEAVEECSSATTAPIAEQPTNSYLFEGQLTDVLEEQGPGRLAGASIGDFLGVLSGQESAAYRPAMEEAPAQSETQLRPEAREEIEAQLVAALSAAGLLDNAAQPRKAPPASKRAVESLKCLILDQDLLQELGSKDGVLCSVCREDLQAGDKAQLMPCSLSHCFHPQCLRPWLEENNSCPICRLELETDDIKYEVQKERKKQEMEEQKGAANAQSHNDFMYV